MPKYREIAGATGWRRYRTDYLTTAPELRGPTYKFRVFSNIRLHMENELDRALKHSPNWFILVRRDDWKWFAITQNPFKHTKARDLPSEAVSEALERVEQLS